jgi:hypothetical protein
MAICSHHAITPPTTRTHIFASAVYCKADGCATNCIGDSCAYECQGVNCGARCKGAECASKCGSQDEDKGKPSGWDDDNLNPRYNDDWEPKQPGFVEQTYLVDPTGRFFSYEYDDDVVFHPDFPESVDCGMECEGTDCAKSCTGAGCGASCTGLNCAANCQGTVLSFVGRMLHSQMYVNPHRFCWA